MQMQIPLNWKAKFGCTGETLAQSLPRFSFDVVGVVAEYAMELRPVKILDTPSNTWKICISPRNELVFLADHVHIFSQDGAKVHEIKLPDEVITCSTVHGKQIVNMKNKTPEGIAFEDNNIYVTDRYGMLSFCNYNQTTPISSKMITRGQPISGICRKERKLFICHNHSHGRIHEYDLDHNKTREYWHGCVPDDIVVLDSGLLVVHSQACFTSCPSVFQLFDTKTLSSTPIYKWGRKDVKWRSEASLAVDHKGHIWISQLKEQAIQEFSADGSYIREFSLPDTEKHWPVDIAFDSQGYLYVLMNTINQVVKYHPL